MISLSTEHIHMSDNEHTYIIALSIKHKTAVTSTANNTQAQHLFCTDWQVLNVRRFQL